MVFSQKKKKKKKVFVVRLCLDKDSNLRIFIVYFCNKRPFKLKMRGALIPVSFV